MTDPLVSVCIPTYNGERFIEATIRSVLQQTYANLEVLVSDHSSTDRTMELLRTFDDPRLTVSVLPRGGTAADNWNEACRNARGEFVKLVCQDDILKPGCIANEVAALRSAPQATFCYGPRDVISPHGRTILRARCFRPPAPLVTREATLAMLVRSGTNIFGEPCAVLMRTSALRGAPPFEGSYLIDLGMWLSLWGMGPALFVDTCDSQFRISSRSWSTALKREQSRQFGDLLEELRTNHPDLCSQRDVRRGRRMAKIQELGRSVLTTIVELLRI